MTENSGRDRGEFEPLLNNLLPVYALELALRGLELIYRVCDDRGIVLPEPKFITPTTFDRYRRGYFSKLEQNGCVLECATELLLSNGKDGWLTSVTLRRDASGQLRLFRDQGIVFWQKEICGDNRPDSWLSRHGGANHKGVGLSRLSDEELCTGLSLIAQELLITS